MNKYWAGTQNYTSGNDGIAYLFPHWTAGGFAGSVSTLQNPSRQASAHYVIEGAKAAQLVKEGDTAWHCGNWWYNRRSISYELVGWPGNPPSKATLDTAAQLMAQASRTYFGGAKLVLGKNVKLHKDVAATSCPGETDIAYLVAKANELLGGAAPKPAPSKPASAGKDNTTIAKEVIAGKWGNGANRQNRLTAAGYNYTTIQTLVNKLLGQGRAPAVKPKPIVQDLTAVAKSVIAGNYGNGQARYDKLAAQGYNAQAVQNRVNELLGQGGAKSAAPAASLDDVARAVIRGDYGNGQARFDKLTRAGYNAQAVQNRVNQLLG